MDKQRIIEKIKKCMALGESSNANEAAAALRQAQKMMNMHGLTEDDIEGSNYSNDTVECPIQANKKVPVHLSKFVSIIMKAFQVKAVIETNVRVSDASYRIRYFGPNHRVTMAAYAHVVIFRAMERAWKDQLLKEPSWKGVRGARLSFMVGWLSEIAGKVDAIGWPEGEEERTEMVKNEFYGKELVKGQQRSYSLYGGIANQGRAAAADFNINRPVNGGSQLRLGRK